MHHLTQSRANPIRAVLTVTLTPTRRGRSMLCKDTLGKRQRLYQIIYSHSHAAWQTIPKFVSSKQSRLFSPHFQIDTLVSDWLGWAGQFLCSSWDSSCIWGQLWVKQAALLTLINCAFSLGLNWNKNIRRIHRHMQDLLKVILGTGISCFLPLYVSQSKS